MKKLLFLFVSLFAVQVAMADEDPTIASFEPTFSAPLEDGSSAAIDASKYATDCAVEIKQFGHQAGNIMTLDEEYFYKFNSNTFSSAYVKITLTSGSFQAGDIVHAEYTLSSNSASPFGLKFSSSTSTENSVETIASGKAGSKGELTHELITGDFSDGVLYIGRGGTNGAKIFVHKIWVTRSKEDATTEFKNKCLGFAYSAGTNAGQEVTTNSTGAVTYSSSNTGVVTVNEYGELTAVAAGKAVITANVAADATYYASADNYTVYVLSNGDGSIDKPYQPTDVRYLAENGLGTDQDKWVQGYIVGAYNKDVEDVKIGSGSATATLGLANSASETIGSNCLAVRFVNDGAAQTYLNLKDNTEMLGQLVRIKGIIGVFTTSEQTVKGLRNAQDFRYGEESLDVTIDAIGYATFSAMRGYALPDEMDAYTVSSYADENVTLKKIDEKIVPAFTGVILKGKSGTLTANETEVSLGSNSMMYNVKAKTMTETEGVYTNFILVSDGKDGVKFAKVSGGTLAANKAYLQLQLDGDARELSIVFDDGETTSISEKLKVKSEEFAPAAAMYDLQGRRVAQPTKGLYIVNGKKYIVK